MSLLWGVQPVCVQEAKTIDALIINAERELLKRRLVKKGDSVIITAGYPLGVPGTTNLMQLARVGQRGFAFSERSGKRG
jgi:pyruvate kinase